ncbi:hypothetical protein ACWEKM_31500 [Streptomyces sp. NPDC004752]
MTLAATAHRRLLPGLRTPGGVGHSLNFGLQRHRTRAAFRPVVIGDSVYPAFHTALRRCRDLASVASDFLARRRHFLFGTVNTVEDLVEQVIGTSLLPRDDNKVTLLIACLHQHLPHLERIVGEANPDLVRQARRIRNAPLPEGHMPLVILAIRLAEIAQALIDAMPVDSAPERRHVPSEGQAMEAPEIDASAVLDSAGHAPAPLPDLTTVRDAAQADPLPHRAVPSLALASAAAGSPGGCGPPS